MTVTQRDDRETKVRRFYDDVWSRGDMDAADEILDPDFRFILTFLTIEDREALKALVRYNRGVFEGLTYTCAPGDVVVDGDSAAAYWTMNARHVGEWRKVPASHKDVSIEGLSFFRFSADGSIREVRVHNDVLGLMRQIGGVQMVYG